MATIDGAARIFRQQGKGTAVGISSVSAFKGIPGSAAYSASKAGFSSYLDTTRIELKKHGISVVAVHPGFVKTDIAPNMEKYPFVISAEKAAKDIVNAIKKKKRRLVIGIDAKALSFVQRLFPSIYHSFLIKGFKMQRRKLAKSQAAS